MKRVKRRIWSGSVLEQEIYTVGDHDAPKSAKPRLRFKDDAERIAHREKQQLREFTRWINANFTNRDIYATLTLDDEHEVHTFPEAKRLRENFARRLQRRYPDAVFCIVCGRGMATQRIHYHMVVKGLPVDMDEAKRVLREVWGMGAVTRVEPMRKRNILSNGMVVGMDYSGLAAYLWRHWTPEQGGHHCYKTRNGAACEKEDARECKTEYSLAKPPRVPRAPDGMEWVLCDHEKTRYGYQWYKWTLMPVKRQRGERLHI